MADRLPDRALAEIADVVARLVASPDSDSATGNALSALTAVIDREVERRTVDAAAHRELVERVVDALPVGLYVIDREYRVQLWNHKRETDTTGVSRDEALGRPIFDVLPRQNAEVLRAEFDQAFASGEAQHYQIESRSTGEARTYRLTKVPMRSGDELVTHVLTLGEDVTEWRAALERTAQAEKLAAIGQLAAGVMHEINNPLATIAACAETMALAIAELPPAKPAPQGFSEYLRIVDHEVHRCRGIIDGLLNFSRAKPVRRVPVELNVVVEQTLFLLKHHKRFKRAVVHLELAPAGVTHVVADPDQLTQVMMALLLNAADAVAEREARDGASHAITVRTLADADTASAAVIDEGTGIPRDELTKIFEPFYTTKEPGAGTGLGLSICYGIVRDHGGRIVVDSAAHEGTTFRVELPAAPR